MCLLSSVIASVGAAGVPKAGLVTITLVFTAGGLPVRPIPRLLTVDRFLDRCWMMNHVLSDIKVSCLLVNRPRESIGLRVGPGVWVDIFSRRAFDK